MAQHPLRERLRGLLILALYRSGRQAEALETYRETRRILVEELGIEPSQELRDLERAILRQDPALAPVAPPVVPSEAPAFVRRRVPSRAVIVAAALLVSAGAATAGVLAQRDDPPAARSAQPPALSPEPPPAAPLAERPPPAPPPTSGDTQPQAEPPAPPPEPPPGTTTRRGTQPQAPTETRRGSTTTRRRTTTTTTARRRSSTPPASNPAPPAPVPPAVYTFADDFDDPLFDFNLWHELSSGGEGADLEERGGRLEGSVAADSRSGGPHDHVERHYGANCRATGDFDARVAFELLAWPSANGVSASLGAYVHDRDAVVSVARESSARGERYAASLLARSRAAATTDDAGWLRLARKEGRLTAYHGRPRSWKALGSAAAAGPVTFVVAVTAPGALFARTDVGVAFDNFTATSRGVACPAGTPRPPRTS